MKFGSWLLRHARRAIRALRWCVKGLLGKPRTLVLELRWRLGDEIMALPVVEAVARTHPEARIHVLTHYPELFEGSPFVSEVNSLPPAIDRYVLLRGADRRRYRAAEYARKAGVPVPDAAPRLYFTDWRTDLLPEPGKGAWVAIAPETTWATKRWPEARWLALCETLRARGLRVAVLGMQPPQTTWPVDTDLRGQTSVREAACVLRHAAALVSCDCGLMHLGLAAGTPVVALFGPTEPGILIRDHPRFVPVRSTLECHGYWNRLEPEPDPQRCPWGHEYCLSSIEVNEVVAALCAWLPPDE